MFGHRPGGSGLTARRVLPRVGTAIVAAVLGATLLAATVNAAPAPDYRSDADAGVAALQRWYNPSTGLFSTTGWWNSANALNAIIDYSARTGSTYYRPDIANTFDRNAGGGFINNYYDDEGWWALTWINAFDLTGDPRYLEVAKSIFADIAASWDPVCSGGVYWSKARTYKNAIANELFMSLAARLHERTPNDQLYLGWALRDWSWFKQSGMINAASLVNDGLNLSTCQNNHGTTWTYNQGVILGGLTDLFRSTGDHAYLDQAEAIADAATHTLVNANGILVEPCEPSCGADGTQFKGIFTRNLFSLYRTDLRPAYLSFVQANAGSIWANDRNGQNQLGLRWAGPFDRADAARQSSALDALNAAIPLPPGQDPAVTSLSSTQVTIAPGGRQTVTLGAQVLGRTAGEVTVIVSPPALISVTPSRATVAVQPGAESTVAMTVSAATSAPENFFSVSISVSADGRPLPSRQLVVLVAGADSLLRSFNNAGISSDGDQPSANFDGGGYSYSAQALAQAGLRPGASLTERGTRLTWPVSPPGYPDNVVAAGQTIPIHPVAGAAQIGFLGAAAHGPSGGAVTLTYTDGTAAQFELGLSDWSLAAPSQPAFGNVQVATTPYRNCDCGASQAVGASVFYAGLPLDTARTLVSITLPRVTDQGTLHLFAIGTSATPVAGPLVTGLQPWTASAGQQVTILGSGFGASSGQVALSDGGTTWGTPGSAALQVNSWSDTAVTFTVPTPDGGLRVSPGTLASVTVTTATGATSNGAVLEIAPTANPADYYDNAGISPDANQGCANMDGLGFTYSAEALAAAGLTPGATVSSGGISFLWPNVQPCSPDNILAAGQTMLVPGVAGASRLGVLGSSTSGATRGTVVVTYTDGTTSTGTLSFNDWASGPGNGDTAVATMPYRNASSGSSQHLTMYVFATTVAVDASRTVTSITFPNVSNKVGSGTPAMHVFAVSLGS